MFLEIITLTYINFDIFIYYISLYSKKGQKSQNGQKLVKKGSNEKNKTTLFSETLKVQIIKVVLFFSFEVILTIFGIFFGFLVKNHKIA